MAIDPDVQDQLDGVNARLRDLETNNGGVSVDVSIPGTLLSVATSKAA